MRHPRHNQKLHAHIYVLASSLFLFAAAPPPDWVHYLVLFFCFFLLADATALPNKVQGLAEREFKELRCHRSGAGVSTAGDGAYD